MLVKQQFDSRLVRVNQVSSTVGNVENDGPDALENRMW
jgi:hypothetical protein